MGTPIPKAALFPGAVPAEELPGLWRQSIAPFFDAQPIVKADGGHSLPDIHQFHLDKLLFIDARFPAQTFVRDAAWARHHDDSDHLALQLLVRGENNVSNGKDDYIENAQNIYAVNLAYTVDAASTDAHVLSLILPRDLVAETLPHLADARGAVFVPGSSGAHIFADHMLSLARNLPQATVEETPGVVAGTLGLLDALSLRNDAAAGPASRAVLGSVIRYIDSHLQNPALGPDSICKYLRCSRSTLYRLLKPHGGVHQYIQRRRLTASFRAISSLKQRHRRIFDIALDFGFVSPSHFSHLFHEHFGMTPRDARDLALHDSSHSERFPPPDGSGRDEAERMWQWAKTLARQAKT